jgi:single-strand DNA-binding protein
MSSLNKVMLIGRLGQDPEMRQTQGGVSVANMSIATDESYRSKDGEKVEKTEWHRVVAFGRVAELCGEYLCKGRQVYVEGSIETREWEDKDGNRRWTTEVKAFKVQFLGSGRSDSGGGGPYNSGPAPKKDGGLPYGGAAPPAGGDFNDDDVPF